MCNTAVENSAVLSKKDLVCNISVEASEWHVFMNHVLSHMGQNAVLRAHRCCFGGSYQQYTSIGAVPIACQEEILKRKGVFV